MKLEIPDDWNVQRFDNQQGETVGWTAFHKDWRTPAIVIAPKDTKKWKSVNYIKNSKKKKSGE